MKAFGPVMLASEIESIHQAHGKIESPKLMERAGTLIGKLNRARQMMTNEELACASWPQAVGKKIAQYTAPVALVRKCLVIEVQDMVWQRQLNTLRKQIVDNLVRITGPGVVDDLEFRPMTPKRMPQRAEVPHRMPVATDEADAIADPLLRRVYRISRKKATA